MEVREGGWVGSEGGWVGGGVRGEGGRWWVEEGGEGREGEGGRKQGRVVLKENEMDKGSMCFFMAPGVSSW